MIFLISDAFVAWLAGSGVCHVVSGLVLWLCELRLLQLFFVKGPLVLCLPVLVSCLLDLNAGVQLLYVVSR